jgi:hypothetical protein
MEAIRLVILRKKERLDRLEVRELPGEFLDRVPQIALISGFRKFSS